MGEMQADVTQKSEELQVQIQGEVQQTLSQCRSDMSGESIQQVKTFWEQIQGELSQRGTMGQLQQMKAEMLMQAQTTSRPMPTSELAPHEIVLPLYIPAAQ